MNKKPECNIDETTQGIDLNDMASASTSTCCDSPVKPLTMDTLLEAKRLLQRGYKRDWFINKVKWVFGSAERIFHCFVTLPGFIYCSIFAISEFGFPGIFLIFMGLICLVAIMGLCDFIS